jgi:hypothetical protein
MVRKFEVYLVILYSIGEIIDANKSNLIARQIEFGQCLCEKMKIERENIKWEEQYSIKY